MAIINKKEYTIGVDIGGTKMSAVLFDGENVIADYVLATPKDDLGHFLIMLKALIEPLQERARELKVDVKGLGIGVAGVMDDKGRKMIKSPNLPILDDVNIADMIEEAVGMQILMQNDGNTFLLAEIKKGVAQKYKNIFGLVIGTGIGGAWFMNDNFYNGFRGGGPEPGRMMIDQNSSYDFEKMYQELTKRNGANLAQDAYNGDVTAIKAYEELGDMLGIVLANIVNVIDPEVIVLGGSVVQSSELFLPSAKKTMRDLIMSKESKKIKVLVGKTGNYAGAIGAACLVE